MSPFLVTNKYAIFVMGLDRMAVACYFHSDGGNVAMPSVKMPLEAEQLSHPLSQTPPFPPEESEEEEEATPDYPFPKPHKVDIKEIDEEIAAGSSRVGRLCY